MKRGLCANLSCRTEPGGHGEYGYGQRRTMLDKRRRSQQLDDLWVLESDKRKAYQIGVELPCILSRFSDKRA